MMRYCDDPNFFRRDLIDEAIGESAQSAAPPFTAKDRADHGVCQDLIRRSLELGYECQPELGIRARRVEGRNIMQLGKGERNNYELHFKAART